MAQKTENECSLCGDTNNIGDNLDGDRASELGETLTH
jgi:hypothetical protein